MKTAAEIETALSYFTGTENYYRHWLRRLVFTDGIHAMIQLCEAMWLVDAIASHQTAKLIAKCDGFQSWTFKRVGAGGVLTCQADSDKPNLVHQEIPYSSFPLDEIKLWVEGMPNDGGVGLCLLLPSEH